MVLQGLIDRGYSYMDVNVRNIDEKQNIVNEWFDDVLELLKAEYGKTKFYDAIEERLIRLSGYESTPITMLPQGKMDVPIVQEMEFRVKDYKYRLERILAELERICAEE